ncbi:DUF4232 domain-containing protein [Streptomyces sp. NPDC054834]
MSARTTRTRLFAAATVALAAFTLTACDGGTGPRAEGSSPSTTATGGQGGKSSDSGSSGSGSNGSGSSGSGTASGTTGSGGSSGSSSSSGSNGSSNSSGTSGGKGSSASSTGQGGSGAPGKCTAATTRTTATEVTRPLNHLLLTVTNTGSKACVLPPYPKARFGEAQSVPPVAKETQPQAVTVLAPGESGYAGVLLSAGDGSAEGGGTVHSLTVPFDDGSTATVALPAKGVYVDNSLTVTYWLPSMDNALDY